MLFTTRHPNPRAAAMPIAARAVVCVERIEKRGGQPTDTVLTGRPQG